LLFEGELTAGAVGGGDDVAGEVVSAQSDPSAVLPLLGNGCVEIVTGVVGAVVDGEEQVVADVERPTGGVVVPEPPLYGGGDVQLAEGR